MRETRKTFSLLPRMRAGVFGFAVLLLLLLNACAPAAPVSTQTPKPVWTQTGTATTTSTQTATATLTVTASLTPTSTPTQTSTNTSTATLSPTATSTSTPIPTYEILRGRVNVDRVMCFYGPHRAYLFKYGLLGGSILEILGINTDTQYIQIRAIGGDNPCWMNLEWMDVRGEVGSLAPIDALDVKLPMSPYYGPLSGAAAVRSGNEVTISWNPFYLNPGDDSEQEPYLVETWVCQDGRQIFIPIGAYINQATVIDEPGCDQPSFGRVYAVEKHGYTRYIEVPWPDFE